MSVGYLGRVHAVCYLLYLATLGTKCTFPIATLPYTALPYTALCPTLSHPTIPVISFHTIISSPYLLYPTFPSIYILFHSTLSYSSVLYPKLLHPIPIETDQNDPGQKQLVLLGQIDLPSGDKAETTRRK